MTTKTFTKVLFCLALSVAVFAIGYVSGCSRKKCPEPQVITSVHDSITRDTVKIITEIVKPVPVSITVDSQAVYELIKNKSPQELDELYLDYYAEREYDTTVTKPDNYRARIRATCNMNRTTFLGFDIENLRATQTQQIVNQTIVNNCKTKFILGGGIDYNYSTKLISLHASIGVVMAKHLTITASVNPFSGSVYATGYYNLYKH